MIKEERNNNNSNNRALAGKQVKNALEKFPEGIHVLAVDDDATCLLWLENLLLECNYRATTTMYARDALDMLRQNKGIYDLVITDVQMPEIDGFQLLETIGLEMDLPVIMLSMYNDPDYVERGVVHGAVDYLVKPVRREEIRNIWQHVLRRRRGIDKGKRTAKPDSLSLGAVNGPVTDSTVSGGGTSTKKRRGAPPSDKDDEDYEEEEDEDSGRDNDEQTSQKRPRVVWTPDLHKKFVLAVNQLGMDKAVPKKILDVMDVGGLTRENVASHLQKYRMYLKRISDVNQQQQQPMFGSLGRSNSLEAMNNYHRTSSLPNSLLSGYPPSLRGILGGRPNSITGVNICGISSSDLIHSGQNLRNSMGPLARLNPDGNLFQNGNAFQGGFEQDSSQAGKTIGGSTGGFNSVLGSTGFGVSDNFSDHKAVMNGSSSNNGLMFSAASQFSQTSSGVFKFGAMGGSSSSGSLHHHGTPNSWKCIGQMNGTLTADSLPMDSNAMNANGNYSTGVQHQQLVSGAANNETDGSNVAQRWDNGKRNEFNQEISTVFGSLNPIMKANGNGGIVSSAMGMGQNQNLNNDSFVGQVNGSTAQNGILGNNDSFIIPERANLPPQDDYIPNSIETMDDIVNSMIGRENNGGPSTMFDEEFNFDDFSPGSGL